MEITLYGNIVRIVQPRLQTNFKSSMREYTVTAYGIQSASLFSIHLQMGCLYIHLCIDDQLEAAILHQSPNVEIHYKRKRPSTL